MLFLKFALGCLIFRVMFWFFSATVISPSFEDRAIRRAIITGGSIGGLFVAAMLRQAGWDAQVYERAAKELSGRGAGIVTHDELLAILKALDIDCHDLGVKVEDRLVFDRQGEVVRQMAFPQIVTSWDRIHQLLRRQCPDDAYHLGHVLSDYETAGETIVARFENGREVEADLLVGADGFASAARARMQPAITPVYSGYVVWRALAREADLPADVHRRIFSAFSFFAPKGTQIIGYPIAGPGNDLRPGHRRYNFVWYTQVADAQLAAMLTDDQGQRHPVTIPPPLIRDAVLRDMEADARERLPDDFNRMLAVSERPFFTPIYDHHAPVMGEGRVALAGDAACVARPHVGMGVTKAACDAVALRDALARTDDIPAALKAYSDERSPACARAFERSRQLGDYIFADTLPDDRDGRSHPHLDEIMRLTATIVD